jgi:hypothetical protein
LDSWRQDPFGLPRPDHITGGSIMKAGRSA